MKNNLKYFTYVESNNEIKKYNIFNNISFLEDLEKISKKFKKYIKETYEENNSFDKFQKLIEKYKDESFKEEIRKSLIYYFWSKCEWEIVLTSWPTFMEKAEIERLSAKKDDIKYREVVSLTTAEKIDVYDQVNLNFDLVIDIIYKEFIKNYFNRFVKDHYNKVIEGMKMIENAYD